MKLEELYRRKKNGPQEEEQYDWEPKRPDHDWTLPNFEIKIPNSNNGVSETRKILSKILTFIKIVQAKRFSDGCTEMPIPTHSKAYLNIWNSPKGISNAIDKMEAYGLIVLENSQYRFTNYKNESYCQTYLYFVDNEKKLIEYCKENGIEPFEVKSAKGFEPKIFKKIEKKNTGFNFEIEDVRFSNDLTLEKPDGMSTTEFEEILLYCLELNYPHLGLIKHKVDEINERFYKERPQFAIKFEPTFHWNKTNDVVEGIVIRATNSFSNKKKIKRYWIKKRNEFSIEQDMKSSVPRLTLSLNLGHWVGEDEVEDIYKLINDEFEPGKKCTKVRRNAIKEFHMNCYFDENSDAVLGRNVWRKIDREGANKDETYDLMKRLRKAVIKAEGGKLYGVEIFFIESCVYLMTLYDLLCTGIDTWLVYDAFYCKDFEDSEMFKMMVNNSVKSNFEDFLSFYKFNEK